MRDRFVDVVESTLGRSVIGYMSQINADPDAAIELFLLEPHEEKLIGEHEQIFDDDDPEPRDLAS